MWVRYTAEQEDIKNMKEYVARFGHGTASNARQAKSKQKLLDKKLDSGCPPPHHHHHHHFPRVRP